jgi:hypothetical protein
VAEWLTGWLAGKKLIIKIAQSSQNWTKYAEQYSKSAIMKSPLKAS